MHPDQLVCTVLVQLGSDQYTWWLGPNFIADRAKIAHTAGEQLRVESTSVHNAWGHAWCVSTRIDG